jgi:hypothetical protein
MAQRSTPPGLKLAHAAAKAPPPSIARSTAEKQPAWIRGYLRPAQPWKTLEPSFSSPYLPSPEKQRRRRIFFPAAGALAGGGGELRRPVLDRDELPLPVPLTPASLSLNSTKNALARSNRETAAPWRVAALLPAPSLARASTPWVSARPSSGPVVAPKRIPRTPTTQRRAHALHAPHGGGSNPHRGGGPCG